MSDPFAAYQLPKGLVEGVEIPLVGTPAKFRVKLPSGFDEDFSTRIMVKLAEQSGDDGVKPMDFEVARREVFFEDCILSFEGLPEGMEPADFFEKYPLARREVYRTAREIMGDADAEVSEALGKLKPSQNGKYSGADAPSNTKKS